MPCTMPLNALLKMSFENYGLSDEEYLTILQDKTKLHAQAFKTFVNSCLSEGLDPSVYGDRFIWSLFQETIYSTDEECRLIQKEKDPAAVKRRSYDFSDNMPTREDLMNEIKELKELLTKA